MCACKHCNYVKVDDIFGVRLGMQLGNTLDPQVFRVHTMC